MSGLRVTPARGRCASVCSLRQGKRSPATHGSTTSSPVPTPPEPRTVHGAGLAELRQELGVREAGADHQQGVAVPHQLVGGAGAEQADGAGDLRQVVGERVLAEQRIGHPRAEDVRQPFDLLPRTAGALADQDGGLVTCVEHLGGAP